MEERQHATTQNWFYPGMSNVNKNITVEAKLISPPTYNWLRLWLSYRQDARAQGDFICRPTARMHGLLKVKWSKQGQGQDYMGDDPIPQSLVS